MKILSVCRGDPQRLPGKTSPTGINKHPVARPVMIDQQGIVGDSICNRKYHGGPDQAIYVMGSEDITFWSMTLNRQIGHGFFGENLVIDGLDSSEICVGDRLKLKQILLEVTAARIPCKTLATRVGQVDFAHQFRNADHPGFYCRVLSSGFAETGEDIILERFQGFKLPVPRMLRGFNAAILTNEERLAYLGTPLAHRFKSMLEQEK